MPAPSEHRHHHPPPPLTLRHVPPSPEFRRAPLPEVPAQAAAGELQHPVGGHGFHLSRRRRTDADATAPADLPQRVLGHLQRARLTAAGRAPPTVRLAPPPRSPAHSPPGSHSARPLPPVPGCRHLRRWAGSRQSAL